VRRCGTSGRTRRLRDRDRDGARRSRGQLRAPHRGDVDRGIGELEVREAQPVPERELRAQRQVDVLGRVVVAGVSRADQADVRPVLPEVPGAMPGMQALMPLMSRGGAIVNIGSAAAVTPHHTVAYTASKWGLRRLSAVAATEYGSRYEQATASPKRELRIFTEDEGGTEHISIDNMPVVGAWIADWVADTFHETVKE
jgi:NADP-dependent 3-hydroxy acid dehydrogenase YdfG